MVYQVVMDEGKCIGWGECAEIFPVEVCEIQNEKSVVVNGEDCLGCENCTGVCEQQAITVSES